MLWFGLGLAHTAQCEEVVVVDVFVLGVVVGVGGDVFVLRLGDPV